MIKMNNNNFCGICEENKLVVLTKNDEFAIKKCKKCKLEKLEIYTNKKSKKDNYDNIDINLLKDALKNVRIEQYKKVIESIKKIRKKGNWLDIGCSFGWFLKEIQNSGYTAYGIEPSKKAYLEAKKIPKIKIYNDLFPTSKIKIKFDIISMMDVFEHIDKPLKMVKNINKSLKKSGLLIIKIPNSKALMYRYIKLINKLTFKRINEPLKRMWQLQSNSLHYFYYNKKNIEKLFKNNGLILKDYFEENEFDTQQINQRISFFKMNKKMKMPYMISMKLIITLSNLLKNKDACVLIFKKIS